jgi:hypothetical protein
MIVQAAHDNLPPLAPTLATKTDVNDAVQMLKLAMRDQAITLITWMTGILIAQGALVVALIQYFK